LLKLGMHAQHPCMFSLIMPAFFPLEVGISEVVDEFWPIFHLSFWINDGTKYWLSVP
jgi:hypothetical protein